MPIEPIGVEHVASLFVLADSVTVQFVAGPAVQVKLSAPAKLEIGEQATVSIAVEDRFGNPVSGEALGLRATRGRTPNQAFDAGGGQYTFVYTSPETRGKDTLIASTPIGKTGTAEVLITDSLAVIRSVQVTPTLARAGETITVEMVAEAGGKANFTIAGVPGRHPMPESEPGQYRGAYTVEAGINALAAMVQVSFEDVSGNRAEKSTSETVTIDTIPPTAPGDLRVERGGIDRENASNVVITATAASGRTVERNGCSERRRGRELLHHR